MWVTPSSCTRAPGNGSWVSESIICPRMLALTSGSVRIWARVVNGINHTMPGRMCFLTAIKIASKYTGFAIFCIYLQRLIRDWNRATTPIDHPVSEIHNYSWGGACRTFPFYFNVRFTYTFASRG